MPENRIIVSEEFVQSLSKRYSKKVLQRIKRVLNLLKINPELGLSNVRESLLELYGKDLREIPVSNFVIIYRYKSNTVQVLALVCGPAVV